MKILIWVICCSLFLGGCSKPTDKENEDEDVSEGQTNWTKYEYWEKTKNDIFIDVEINDIVIRDSIVLIAGHLQYTEPSFALYKSEDYGKTWSKTSHPDSCGAGSIIYDVDSPSDSTIYTLGTCLGWSLYKSIDNGDNWTYLSEGLSRMEIPPWINSRMMHFFTDNMGIIGNLKTTDGGNNWNEIEDLAENFPYTFAFVKGSQLGFCSSKGKILKTLNNGDNWTVVYEDENQFFSEIFFINETIGFVATETELLKTVDGGLSWNSVFSGAIRDISFVSSEIGFIATDKGIFKTTNKGTYWVLNYHSEFIDFNTVAFQGLEFGVAAGHIMGTNFPNNKGYVVVTESQGD